MDWWQCVDLPLLLFATALLFASSSLSSSIYQRLAHFLELDGDYCARLKLTGRLNQANNGLQRLANIQGGRYCVPLWLVWKRLNIASNYTMKPGFLFTFLLAGSTIVHACELVDIFFFSIFHSFKFTLFSSLSISHSLHSIILNDSFSWNGKTNTFDVSFLDFECECVFDCRCGVLYLSVGFSDWKSNSIDARE